MPDLRLLTVSAARHDGTGGDAELATRIAGVGADVVCVHGAPSLLRWRSRCAALARRAGLVVVSGGRTAGGVLLLADLGVDAPHVRDVAFGGHRGPRPPGAGLAGMARLGSPFLLAGVRFAGDAAGQAGQLDRLWRAAAEVAPLDPPAVLCTDGAGPATALALQDGRVAAGEGVFVDARIGLVTAAKDGVVELRLPAAAG